METADYQKQADDFVAKTGIKIECRYQGHRPAFDAAQRAMFLVVIAREGRKPWTFPYYDSLADSYDVFEGWRRLKTWPMELYKWPNTLKVAEAAGGGVVGCYELRKRVPTPTAYDILACVQKSDPGSHTEFCSDFGYDPDSIKGRDTWIAVVDEWSNVRRMFTEEERAELQEIC